MNLESEIKKQKAKNSELKKKGQPQRVYNLIKEKPVFNEPPKGDRFSTCKLCGKQFEQNLSEERNVYSSFKSCPACRKRISQEKTEKVNNKTQKEINVATLPYQPFPAQQKIHEAFETHRFVVIDAGNRFGKDRCSIMIAIKYFTECLNENRAIDHPDMVPSVLFWIIAPTEQMALQNWRELKMYFPKDWVVACSDSSLTMETIGGGIIEVRSAYNPEALVGVGLDGILITEAARIRDLDIVWANLEARLNSPGRGREKDRLGSKSGAGKAIINSSPIGKNYFYTMWKWGQLGSDTYDSNWWSCQCPWTDNPANAEQAKKLVRNKYGIVTYEESLRRRIGERLYKQNYLGDFLALDTSVFPTFEDKCVINLFSNEKNLTDEQRRKKSLEWKKVIPGRSYTAGYDPATGSSGDSPWFSIRDDETMNIVATFNLYGKSYDEQIAFIVAHCKKYNYARLHWLRTGHTALEGKFSEKGIEEIPVDENGHRKSELVQRLVLAVENEDIHVLMDGTEEVQTLILQMNDYSEKKTAAGNSTYSNQEQKHDDAVSSLYAIYSDYTVADAPIFYCGMIGIL